MQPLRRVNYLPGVITKKRKTTPNNINQMKIVCSEIELRNLHCFTVVACKEKPKIHSPTAFMALTTLIAIYDFILFCFFLPLQLAIYFKYITSQSTAL